MCVEWGDRGMPEVYLVGRAGVRPQVCGGWRGREETRGTGEGRRLMVLRW